MTLRCANLKEIVKKSNVVGGYERKQAINTGKLSKILLCHPEFISGSSHRDMGSITESLINHRHIEPPTEGLLLCKYSELTFLHNREKSKANVRDRRERDSEPKSGNAEAFQSIHQSNQRHKALKLNSKFFFFGSLFLFSSPKKEKVNKEQTISKVLSDKLKRHVRGGYATCKAAFTLAEVLITLGIIGVIAAMTLPVIIPKIDKAITVNKLKKSFSTLYQLIQLSEKDNGEVWEWEVPDGYEHGFNDTEFFKKYFEPYLKKVVDYNLTNLSYVEYQTYNIDGDRITTARVWTVLPDGSSIGFFNNSGVDSTVPGGGAYMWIFIDINAMQQPNRLGRDIFMAELVRNKRIVMWGNDYHNREALLSDKYGYSCKKGTHQPYAGGTCGALIQMDGWEIKDDYPW